MKVDPLEVAPAARRVPDSSIWNNKVVLLIDSNSSRRESRAKVMRTLGVTVHGASSARAARLRFESHPYNLVLVDLGDDVESAEGLVREFRSKKPGQLVAFLVGSPLFVATSLKHNRARPARVPPPSTAALPAKKTGIAAINFGERIRNAEGEQLLDDIA